MSGISPWYGDVVPLALLLAFCGGLCLRGAIPIYNVVVRPIEPIHVPVNPNVFWLSGMAALPFSCLWGLPPSDLEALSRLLAPRVNPHWLSALLCIASILGLYFGLNLLVYYWKMRLRAIPAAGLATIQIMLMLLGWLCVCLFSSAMQSGII